MTERELLYVKTVAEEKSISKAAQRLYVSQPSLSKCIQKIESRLGTCLFKRTNNGLILTFAGERYCQVASDIMRIYNDFEIEISDINNLKKGRIIIGCTNYLTTSVLPVILPAYKQKCPNIKVNVVEKNSTDLEKALVSGEIDFAIMHTFPFLDFSNCMNIVFYPICKDPFLLVTSKNHPLSKYGQKVDGLQYPKIDITLFAKEPFIMVYPGQRIRQVTDVILQKANITPNIVLTTKSYETARRLACQGIGVTFVPEHYSQLFTGSYKPDYYLIDEKYSPYWTLCVAIQKDTYVSKASKLFIRMLSEEYGSAPIDL